MAFLIQDLFAPLSKLGESRLVFFFIAIPTVITFLTGNISLYRMLDIHKLVRLLLCIPYSFAAIFVQFITGWSALMTMGL